MSILLSRYRRRASVLRLVDLLPWRLLGRALLSMAVRGSKNFFPRSAVKKLLKRFDQFLSIGLINRVQGLVRTTRCCSCRGDGSPIVLGVLLLFHYLHSIRPLFNFEASLLARNPASNLPKQNATSSSNSHKTILA